MKFYELINILNSDQDKIFIRFPNDNDVVCKYYSINDIPITYCDYKVTEIYGFDSEGYDGIEISLVEE